MIPGGGDVDGVVAGGQGGDVDGATAGFGVGDDGVPPIVVDANPKSLIRPTHICFFQVFSWHNSLSFGILLPLMACHSYYGFAPIVAICSKQMPFCHKS